jgi:outer membrane protein OmpA-like peptidoglycan-associated protein
MIAWLVAAALAQDGGSQVGLDAHGFHPAAFDGDVLDPFAVQRVSRFEPMGMYAGGLFEYADQPLVVYEEVLGEGFVPRPALDDIVALDLSVGLAVHERVRLDLGLPLYLASKGLDGPQGAGIGDLRLGTLVAIVAPEPYGPEGGSEGLALGVLPFLDVPSGNTTEMLGQSKVSGGVKAAFAYGAPTFQIAGDLGFEANPEIGLDNLTGSDELVGGIGIGMLVAPRTGANLEAVFSAPFEKNVRQGTGAPAEGMVSVRHRLSTGGHFVGGAAFPLSHGVGAAAFRAFVGGGWGQSSQYGAGGAKVPVSVVRNGRPFAGALVSGASGGQPFEITSSTAPFTVSIDVGATGRIVAEHGSCLAGEAAGTGPPAEGEIRIELGSKFQSLVVYEVVDQHGYSVPDVRVTWDAHPDGCAPTGTLMLEPNGTGEQEAGMGRHTIHLTAEGYSSADVEFDLMVGSEERVEVVLNRVAQVRVERERIVIPERVYFELNAAVIEQRSFGMLTEVAEVLNAHPGVRRVEVRGHTDNTGTAGFNMILSQQRAEAVRAYLIQAGVDHSRLVAKGYGANEPVDTNDTEQGRARNRRVEFVIVERQD